MKTVYVSNIDAVGKRGHVRGAVARRVLAISARSLLFTDVMGRPIDSFILPSDPGEAFIDYLRETFGPLPEIKVATVDPDNLWIADHIDPKWVSGQSVDCFIFDHDLERTIVAAGGQVLNANRHEVIKRVNHKGHFKDMFRDIFQTVPGAMETGAEAVSTLVADMSPCFLRMALAGGGVGNIVFRQPVSSSDARKLMLESNSLWVDADGLVEPILDIAWSPGAAFEIGRNLKLYSFLQITRRGCEYVGCWMPAPDYVVGRDQLDDVCNAIISKLSEIGFRGEADVDLGVTPDGNILGFEINGRKDGVRHVWQAVSRWHGADVSQWRCAVKAIDAFQLRASEQDTNAVLKVLRGEGLLACKSNPFGAILSIPPCRGLIGVIIIGHDYCDAHQRFLRVNDAIGSVDNLSEDQPLFS